jgi:cysteine desulfurase
MEESRRTVAEALGAAPDEILFTSGGTEANNLAILGRSELCEKRPGHIVTTAVEHPSVYKPLSHLRHEGWQIDYIPIKNGRLDLARAYEMIMPDTCIASVMLVNNETGTIMPAHEIKGIIARRSPGTPLHCDAVQAFGKLRFTADSLGADLISVSGHKIHGPKGIGALYIRHGIKLSRRIFGGGQERGMRSGTEATPLIAGFAAAVRLTMSNFDQDTHHMYQLKQYAIRQLTQAHPDIRINSPVDGAPHIISYSIPGMNNTEAVRWLSEHGICLSASAACKSNHAKGPSMLMNFGLTSEMSDSTLRIGLSNETTEAELRTLAELLVRYRESKLP